MQRHYAPQKLMYLFKLKNTLLWKMPTIIWQHMIATNVQFVKNAVSAKFNKAKSDCNPKYVSLGDF